MQHKDWNSWRNLMPMSTPSLHVTGQVQAANPGVEVSLQARAQAQAGTVALDVHIEQKPGIWAQVLSWKECRYDREMSREAMAGISQVQLFHKGTLLTSITVTDAH